MSSTLRILLLMAGIITAIWILYRIRRSKVKMEDAVFWICMAVILFVMGTCTDLVYWMSRRLGMMAPVNCVFLLIIALLIEKVFTLSIKLSQMEDKMETLAAEVALRTKELGDKVITEEHKEKKTEVEKR